jgi:hypothetical protein
MGGVLEGELFLQAPTRLKEAIGPVPSDRASLALALSLQRPAALTHPRPAALRTGNELLRI